jgi:hypothetical protein
MEYKIKNTIKKNILGIVLIQFLFNFGLNSNDYVLKIQENKNIQITQEESKNNIYNFNLNNIDNIDYNGQDSFDWYCACTNNLSNNLAEGWSYIQLETSNGYNSSNLASGIWNDNLKANLSGTSYNNNDRIGLLVKLPEGFVWFSKKDSWMQGNPRDYLEGINDGNPSRKITITDQNNVFFAIHNFKTSAHIELYNNKSGREYLYINELGLSN